MYKLCVVALLGLASARAAAGPRLWPEPGVRASWSDGYTARDGGTFRLLPSVQFLGGYVPLRCEPTRLGLHASLIDLLGPAAEVALRPHMAPASTVGFGETEYSHQYRLWANFIQPRIALELGLDSLAKSLVLDIGVSARPAAAYLTNDFFAHNSYVSVVYDYKFAWLDHASVTRALEVGIALSYVP